MISTPDKSRQSDNMGRILHAEDRFRQSENESADAHETKAAELVLQLAHTVDELHTALENPGDRGEFNPIPRPNFETDSSPTDTTQTTRNLEYHPILNLNGVRVTKRISELATQEPETVTQIQGLISELAALPFSSKDKVGLFLTVLEQSTISEVQELGALLKEVTTEYPELDVSDLSLITDELFEFETGTTQVLAEGILKNNMQAESTLLATGTDGVPEGMLQQVTPTNVTGGSIPPNIHLAPRTSRTIGARATKGAEASPAGPTKRLDNHQIEALRKVRELKRLANYSWGVATYVFGTMYLGLAAIVGGELRNVLYRDTIKLAEESDVVIREVVNEATGVTEKVLGGLQAPIGNIKYGKGWDEALSTARAVEQMKDYLHQFELLNKHAATAEDVYKTLTRDLDPKMLSGLDTEKAMKAIEKAINLARGQ